MKPGATARPAASIVLLAGPDNLPISTILPSLTPTSPRNAGMPEPSTTRPFLISKSYAIGFLLALGSAAARPDRQHLTTQFPRQSRAFPAWIEAEPCGNSPSPAPRERVGDAERRPGEGRRLLETACSRLSPTLPSCGAFCSALFCLLSCSDRPTRP